MVADSADDRDRVRAAVMAVGEPKSTAAIAAAADVDRTTAARHLAEFADDGAVESIETGGTVRYVPDPVAAYVEFVGDASTVEEARIRSVRDEVRAWRSVADLRLPDRYGQYRMGGQLVASSRLAVGTDAFEDDWDVLVVLDTCRTDALRRVADDLRGVTADAVDDRLSLGSQTAEWICQTFTADHSETIAGTGYVSGNGWAKGVFEDGLRPDDDLWFDGLSLPTTWDVVDADALAELVHAWGGGDGEYSAEVPWAPHPSPRVVTDHAIALARERDLDQLVVHYKQPHAPYTERARAAGRTELTAYERAPFEYLARGGDPDHVRAAYFGDLQAAIEEINALCENVDGTVAITADHGEAFGEDGEYGHRPAMLHPTVRRVPWVTTEATDRGTREGDLSVDREGSRDLDQHLESLGYR